MRGRQVRRFLPVVAAFSIGGMAVLGWTARNTVPTNQAVLRLPGITRSYIDSLVQIVGRPVAIETLSTREQGIVMVQADSTGLVSSYNIDVTCGWFRNDTIYINPHLISFVQMAELTAYSHAHPPIVATPPGVLAHEFGHLLISKMSKAGPLPPWLVGDGEFVADRFSLVVLALRVEAPRASQDTMLVRFVVHQLGGQLLQDQN